MKTFFGTNRLAELIEASPRTCQRKLKEKKITPDAVLNFGDKRPPFALWDGERLERVASILQEPEVSL